jgi:hypothetical protein
MPPARAVFDASFFAMGVPTPDNFIFPKEGLEMQSEIVDRY